MESYDPNLLNDAEGPSSQVQLFISCRNLKNLDIIGKSDPYCEIYLKNDSRSKWIKIGKTDTVMNSLNPDFATPITISYYFEKDQEIRFEVYDLDPSRSEEQGSITTKVGRLVGARNQTYVDKLTHSNKKGDRGEIIVKTDTVKGSNKSLKMTVKVSNLPSK